MPRTADYDLLASKYLNCQDAGPRLRDLARMVAAYRHNNQAPGRRSARKADLNAVAGTAARLQKALAKIDIGTQETAVAQGVAMRNGGAVVKQASAVRPVAPGAGEDPTETSEASPAPIDLGPSSRLAHLDDLLRLKNLLDTVVAGFGALSDSEEVVDVGGRPERHDALLMGLEGLKGVWAQYRREPPNQSENERGFGALAIDLFAAAPVGFPVGTVRGAVVDLLPLAKSG